MKNHEFLIFLFLLVYRINENMFVNLLKIIVVKYLVKDSAQPKEYVLGHDTLRTPGLNDS